MGVRIPPLALHGDSVEGIKVDVKNVSDIEKRLTVAIPPNAVDTEIDKAYVDLKKKVKLKGFRPGKAPISILQRYFKAQVEEDVISKLVKDTYTQALDEIQAKPVSQPKIENGVLEKGKEFSYTAVFEIKPDIAVTDYENLELEKEEVEVTDDDVTKEIDSLRNSYATLQEVTDRAIKQGDCVVFDYEGTVDGSPYPGNVQKDFFLEMTEDAFIPGFSQHLIGLTLSAEKDFSLDVPEEYINKDIAGKNAAFHVIIKNIKEKIMPVADDEFAKDLGEYTDLEDLKHKLQKALTERRRMQADAALKEKIFDIIIEKNPFEVPKSMVDMQIRNMMYEMQQMLQAQGLKLEDMGQPVEQMYEQYRTPAERQVRSALLLGAIAQKEALTAAEEDFEKKYQELAKQYQQDVAVIKSKLDRELIQPQILERKAIDLIISKARITGKK